MTSPDAWGNGRLARDYRFTGMVVTEPVVQPVAGRFWYIELVFTNASHHIVIAGDQYDQQNEFSIGHEIRPATVAEKF